MQCRNVLTRIDALRTGELEKKEEVKLEQHLEICPSCHDSVDDVEKFASTVKMLVARPPRSCLKKLHEEISDRFDLITTDDQRIWVAFSDHGIRMIDLKARTGEEFAQKYQAKFGRELHREPIPDSYRSQVLDAFHGKAPKRPDVDLSIVTPFERTVLRTILRIPRGEVRPYAWVARQIRHPKAARAVGSVMAHNPVPLLLPCHRVVPTSGGLGNYGFGVAMKRALLSREGAVVKELERGVPLVASKTTHIFCFPTCPDARRIRDENRVALRSGQEAKKRGFRPCQRCQP